MSSSNYQKYMQILSGSGNDGQQQSQSYQMALQANNTASFYQPK